MRQDKHHEPMISETVAAAVFYGAISPLQALLRDLHDCGAEPPTPKLRATLEVLRATLDMAGNHFHDYLESQYTEGKNELAQGNRSTRASITVEQLDGRLVLCHIETTSEGSCPRAV